MTPNQDRRTEPRTDQTASDIYWSVLRETGSHAAAAKAVESVMKAEEESNGAQV